MSKSNERVITAQSYVSEFFIWNDKVFIDMLQNEKPNHQFSFDKYKLKQDLERRLQTVQDNAEEKGLVSDEEIDVESEVKLQ
jgi:outer membrane protein OmpA-like peptidoglycan-associated protein